MNLHSLPSADNLQLYLLIRWYEWEFRNTPDWVWRLTGDHDIPMHYGEIHSRTGRPMYDMDRNEALIGQQTMNQQIADGHWNPITGEGRPRA